MKNGGSCPCSRHEDVWGSEGTEPFIFNRGARWRLAVNITPRPPYPQHRTPVIVEQAVWAFWGGGKNTLTIGDKGEIIGEITRGVMCNGTSGKGTLL